MTASFATQPIWYHASDRLVRFSFLHTLTVTAAPTYMFSTPSSHLIRLSPVKERRLIQIPRQLRKACALGPPLPPPIPSGGGKEKKRCGFLLVVLYSLLPCSKYLVMKSMHGAPGSTVPREPRLVRHQCSFVFSDQRFLTNGAGAVRNTECSIISPGEKGGGVCSISWRPYDHGRRYVMFSPRRQRDCFAPSAKNPRVASESDTGYEE